MHLSLDSLLPTDRITRDPMCLMLLVENLIKVAVPVLRSFISLAILSVFFTAGSDIPPESSAFFFPLILVASHQRAGQLLAGCSSDREEFVELRFWWRDVTKCRSFCLSLVLASLSLRVLSLSLSD